MRQVFCDAKAIGAILGLYVLLGLAWALATNATSAHFGPYGGYAVVYVPFVLGGATLATVASARGAGWRDWALRALRASLYAVPFLVLTILAGIGAIAPLWSPQEVFGHGILRALLWLGVGFPLGLWLMALGGATWVGSAGPKGGFRAAWGEVRRQPAGWMLRAVLAALLVAGMAGLLGLLESHLQGGVGKGLLRAWLFVWIPLAWAFAASL